MVRKIASTKAITATLPTTPPTNVMVLSGVSNIVVESLVVVVVVVVVVVAAFVVATVPVVLTFSVVAVVLISSVSLILEEIMFKKLISFNYLPIMN